jgi:hypothetical protein
MPNDCGRLRIDLNTPKAATPIAIGQLAPLSPGSRLAICFGSPPSRHPRDDDSPVIGGDGVTDPVEQHRRWVGGPVAVRAIVVSHLDPGVSKGPESVMGCILVTG